MINHIIVARYKDSEGKYHVANFRASSLSNIHKEIKNFAHSMQWKVISTKKAKRNPSYITEGYGNPKRYKS